MSKTVNNADQINAVITTNGDATASVDFTPTQDTHVVNKAYVDNVIPNVANPNLIINGGFDIWQRGTSFTGSNQYTADRWFVGTNGDSTSRVASGLPEHPSCIRCVATAGNSPTLYQAIELNQVGIAYPFIQNETYTLSFYVYTDSATDIRVRVEFRTGVNGAGGVGVLPITTVGTTTASTWQKMEISFPVTAVPNPANNCIELVFLPTTADIPMQITGVKLEQGSVATPWFYEDYGTTLAKCQRYFETGTIFMGGATYQIGGNYYHYSMPFVVSKRITPTCTVTDGSVGATQYMIYPNGAPSSSGTKTFTADAEL